MTFLGLPLKHEYRSFEDNVVQDFYIPVLQKSVRYDRAVGFFSSTALIEITRGLTGLFKNNGKIRLIISPKLSEDDIKAIAYGYKQKKEVIEKSLLSVFDEEFNVFQKKRLNLLAHLISNGLLDIKVALIEEPNGIGIFHDKLGIVEDSAGNYIAFSGSLNETANAFSHNYEAIDVFKSWTGDAERVSSKIKTFENIWRNKTKNVVTYDFPQIAMEKLQSYKTDKLDIDIDEKELYYITHEIEERKKIRGPLLPLGLNIRSYQTQAITSWELNDFRGIFSMATGTGKTITGLAAAEYLFRNNNQRLAIIIVCPFQHLVEQWVDDIKWFNMKPIVGHSASIQSNWKKRLDENVEAYNLGVINHFCFITTNKSFATQYVQDKIKAIQDDFLIVIDEAHNFGAEHLQTKLPINSKYRLALSATIERHNDEVGTLALKNYFGPICIEYTLEMAIRNNMLTRYYYYPIPVFLNEDELQEFQELTAQIVRAMRKNKYGEIELTKSAKMLLLKRARIIAGASEKITALEREISKHKHESHLLVYCGTTTINDPNYKENIADSEERRQIDVVVNLLGNKLGMKVAKFTSEESAVEREAIKEAFAEAEHLQALVAIRCLDEGVNIPSIQKAFILASSTNPKEYIQRRGRVLRKFEGKRYAYIYDFITLPIPFELMSDFTEEEILQLNSLPKREIERMKDFASVAENSSVADELISTIQEMYLLNREDVEVNAF